MHPLWIPRRLEARTFRVRTTLGRVAANARRRWREREGVALALRDADGHVGIAEAAPLPGVSSERLEAVQQALGAIVWHALDLAGDDPLEIAARLVPEHLPSARFALECALLDLAGRRVGSSCARLLATGAPAATAAVAVLLDDLDTARARAAQAEGVRAFKVKIGRRGREREEIALLRALRRDLGAQTVIRADANGTLQDASDPRIDALADIGADLLEEPFAAIDALLERPPLPVPVALDESVARDPAQALRALEIGKAQALVLKPARLGLGRARSLAEAAQRRGARAIVSHLYDPPRAFAACAHLALALGGNEIHGLAPYAGLEAWRHAEDGTPIPVPALVGRHGIGTAEEPGLG